MAHTQSQKAKIASGVRAAWSRGAYDGTRFNGGSQSYTTERNRAVAEGVKAYWSEKMSSSSWDEAPLTEKRRRVLHEQGGRCSCGVNEWCGKPLALELHHIDGDNANNIRENVAMLCPNCHSQTPTYRRINARKERPMPPGQRAVEYRRKRAAVV